jgi:hypothetical protein
LNENLVASGDDEGVIKVRLSLKDQRSRADAKLWDHRKEDCIRSYPHHFDYISDFTYFDDKRQLVSTSYVYPLPFDG